jgi:hypothetical protein
MSGRAVTLLLSNLPDVLPVSTLCVRHSRAGLAKLLSGVFAVGVLLLLVSTVGAETDGLLHAPGFALTGSRDVDTKVIGDPAECIFGIKDALRHQRQAGPTYMRTTLTGRLATRPFCYLARLR